MLVDRFSNFALLTIRGLLADIFFPPSLLTSIIPGQPSFVHMRFFGLESIVLGV